MDASSQGGVAPLPAASASRGTKRPAQWSVDDVVAFIDLCELSHLQEKIRENGVDGELLLALSDAEMVDELGLTRLQVRKIRLRLPV